MTRKVPATAAWANALGHFAERPASGAAPNAVGHDARVTTTMQATTPWAKPEVDEPHPPCKLRPDDDGAQQAGREDQESANHAGEQHSAVGPMAAQGQHRHGQREQPHDGAHQSMAELHEGRTLEDRDDSPVAQGPVRAPQAGVGDPHDAAQRHLRDGDEERGKCEVGKGAAGTRGRCVAAARSLACTHVSDLGRGDRGGSVARTCLMRRSPSGPSRCVPPVGVMHHGTIPYP